MNVGEAIFWAKPEIDRLRAANDALRSENKQLKQIIRDLSEHLQFWSQCRDSQSLSGFQAAMKQAMLAATEQP